MWCGAVGWGGAVLGRQGIACCGVVGGGECRWRHTTRPGRPCLAHASSTPAWLHALRSVGFRSPTRPRPCHPQCGVALVVLLVQRGPAPDELSHNLRLPLACRIVPAGRSASGQPQHIHRYCNSGTAIQACAANPQTWKCLAQEQEHLVCLSACWPAPTCPFFPVPAELCKALQRKSRGQRTPATACTSTPTQQEPTHSGVRPESSPLVRLAPARQSALTTATCPFLAARMSGVMPWLSARLSCGAGRASSSARAAASCPALAAQCL